MNSGSVIHKPKTVIDSAAGDRAARRRVRATGLIADSVAMLPGAAFPAGAALLCAMLLCAMFLGAALGLASRAESAESRALCRDLSFAGVTHTVCEVDPRRYRIDLHWRDERGGPYGSLGAVERALARQGRHALITMNAGMYEPDLSPVGLFVAEGREQHPLNTRGGSGNFYLKPNGVFHVSRGKAGIAETRAFLRRGIRPDIATQSGPLLVGGGKVNARFKADGSSRKIRNGVGVRADGTVVLAISRQGISFGQFARLFRDELRCPDALYLDGSVSRLSVNRDAGGPFFNATETSITRAFGTVMSIEKKK